MRAGMKVAEAFARFVSHAEFHDMDLSVVDYVKMLTLKQVMGMVVGFGGPHRQESHTLCHGKPRKAGMRGLWVRFPGGCRRRRPWPTVFSGTPRRWRMISFPAGASAM